LQCTAVELQAKPRATAAKSKAKTAEQWLAEQLDAQVVFRLPMPCKLS
jgi:hypothetical protein